MGMQDELSLLQATNAQVNMLDSGCCGMAGPFGFEKDKFEVSQALGERVLLPAVRSAAPETILVTDGFSCREQIRQNSPRHAFIWLRFWLGAANLASASRLGPGAKLAV